MASSASRLAILRVLGPDHKGIVAACSELLNRHGCSLIKSESFADQSAGMFFQRMVFDYCAPSTDRVGADNELREIAKHFGVDGSIDWRDKRKRVAILVSKYNHCLWELLLRHEANELNCDIPMVISNHQNSQSIADTFRIPFQVFPITPKTKVEQERRQLDLLQQEEIDVVVLARYMQVLSADFLSQYTNRIINIHHSFLPAFSGGRAYHQAHERGVKLIGATAHYATLDLDEGPIIEQDVIEVSHRDEARDFIRKGQILERSVLVRALEAHLDNRVMVYNNKCVVFSD